METSPSTLRPVHVSRRKLVKAAALAAAGAAIAPRAALAETTAETADRTDQTRSPVPDPLDALAERLGRDGIAFDLLPDDRAVRVGFIGRNLDEIDLFAAIDDDLAHAQVASWSIGRIDPGRIDEALLRCNEANLEYRWAGFAIDGDRDVEAGADCVLDPQDPAGALGELIRRMASIVDEVAWFFEDITE